MCERENGVNWFYFHFHVSFFCSLTQPLLFIVDGVYFFTKLHLWCPSWFAVQCLLIHRKGIHCPVHLSRLLESDLLARPLAPCRKALKNPEVMGGLFCPGLIILCWDDSMLSSHSEVQGSESYSLSHTLCSVVPAVAPLGGSCGFYPLWSWSCLRLSGPTQYGLWWVHHRLSLLSQVAQW